MRWSPGPISPNIEDRRFESNPEEKLRALQDAIRRGTLADPNQTGELPPWLWPDDTQLQQAALDKLAFQQAFGGR
jgi:hypothetical protein